MRPTPERRALGVALVAALLVNGQEDWSDNVVGTWTTKSRKVLTGPVSTVFLGRGLLVVALCRRAHACSGLLRSSQRQINRTRAHRPVILFYGRWLL